MASHDNSVHLVFNGEIYNYKSLKSLLTDYAFRTDSDTEVVLALYLTQGVEGLKALKGMFTLALVDEPAQRVILLRDAVGKKPLYLAEHSQGINFGSSVLPILASTDNDWRIAENELDHFWEHAFIRADRSIIEGIRPVKPGECLTLDFDGQLQSTQFCRPSPERIHAGEDAAEIHQNIRTLIDQAVSRRMENNPQPIALLSGGVDSTIIAESMCRSASADAQITPSALTLGSVIPLTQDERYARFAARRLGIRLVRVKPHGGRLSDRIEEAMSAQDEPLGMPSHFLLYTLVKAASSVSKILISGDGGDEVFLGYRSPQGWVSDRESIEATGIQVGPATPNWYSSWANEVSHNTLLGHMFSKVDRASAEQGVEIRSPLLDWDLMAYVRSLPREILIGSSNTKHLLKSQLEAWPDAFVNRRKLGFSYNLRWRWLLSGFSGLRELVEDEAIETFSAKVPACLQSRSSAWKTMDIHRNFSAVWRLISWSFFLRRLRQVI